MNGLKWLMLHFQDYFIYAIFDCYLESLKDLTTACWASLVLHITIILFKVIGGLLRYTGSKLIRRGALYMGFGKGPLTKVGVFIQL